MQSAFSSLFEFGASLLYSQHGGEVLAKWDESDEDEAWVPLTVHLEGNSAQADPLRRQANGQLSRQCRDFLIPVGQLEKSWGLDSDGLAKRPTKHTAIRMDGRVFRARTDENEACWHPEDHEGLVIRFMTTDHGAIE